MLGNFGAPSYDALTLSLCVWGMAIFTMKWIARLATDMHEKVSPSSGPSTNMSWNNMILILCENASYALGV
jgi:hypothetical protein